MCILYRLSVSHVIWGIMIERCELSSKISCYKDFLFVFKKILNNRTSSIQRAWDGGDGSG